MNLLLTASTGKTIVQQVLRRGTPPKALFDFLAQEVLDELPPALRDFAMDCAVLQDLNPARCTAMSRSPDSRSALDALLRRHLFLSVVDEHEPVLRFHDLFRDFLLAQLARKPREHRRALYERAAAAEDLPERSIGHWLDAERWAEASNLIARHGLRLAGEGAYSILDRWMERLPPEVVESEPRSALLRAECAGARWGWERVLLHAAPAAEGLARVDDLPGRLRAQFHLQRAWSAFSLGQCDWIAGHLDTMNALVAEDPQRYAPLVAQTFNCHLGGLPGVTEAYLRFAALCGTVPKQAAMPWHSTPVVLRAWVALWQGRREGAIQALERGTQIQHSFGKVRYVLLDATHLQALLLALSGEFERARRMLEALLADLDSGDADGLRRVWQRLYRCVLPRTLWMALDGEALAAQTSL